PPPPPTPLSLHDALPISSEDSGSSIRNTRGSRTSARPIATRCISPPDSAVDLRWSLASMCSVCATRSTRRLISASGMRRSGACRSEEHTSELQSPYDLVCRLLLEKKKYYLILCATPDSQLRATTLRR